MAEDPERVLLRRISAGDEQALQRFYERFSARVYRFALSRLGVEADAADVVNEVFFEVWRGSAARYQGKSAVATWLLGITHHKILDKLRRRRWCEEGGDAGEDALDSITADEASSLSSMTEKAVEASQDLDRVEACIERLPSPMRQVVYLAFFEDLPYGEIAAILDCPEGTVKTRIHHARRKIKACLQLDGLPRQ